MTTLRYWTPAEEEFIRNNYHRMSATEIAKHIGRSAPTVRGRVRRLGLEKRSTPVPWTPDEDATLKQMHASHASVEQIAERLGRTVNSVRLRASKYWGMFRDDRYLKLQFRGKNFYGALKASLVRKKSGARCCLCPYETHVDLHHCDGDRSSHGIENIASLCPNHHREVEAGAHADKLLFCIWWRVYSDGRRSVEMTNKDLRAKQ